MVTGEASHDQGWDTLDNFKKDNCPDAEQVFWRSLKVMT
jgi:hypothetical protein